MKINPNECKFETFESPLGSEYGDTAGRIHPGVRVTHFPTGATAEYKDCPLEVHNAREAMNLLSNELASNEQKILAEAIAWSNADMYFTGSEYATNNQQCLDVADDIARGLKHLGWKIVSDDTHDVH